MKIQGKEINWKPITVNGVAIEGEFEVIVDGISKGPRGITPITGITTPTITKDDAERRAGGRVIGSKLYLAAKGSKVLTHPRAAERPHWVVMQRAPDNSLEIILVDAVTGEITGKGTPPPSDFCSVTGPTVFACPEEGSWYPWADNATEWFQRMGLNGATAIWPTYQYAMDKLRDPNCAAFYELCHGGWESYWLGCNGLGMEFLSWFDVRKALMYVPKISFAFLGSCHALDYEKPESLSHQLRKGLSKHTCVVGFRRIGEPDTWEGWLYAYPWQDKMFAHMAGGATVGASFDAALMEYPMCAPMTGIEGDRDFAGPYTRSLLRLNLPKTTFSTSDRLVVTADIDPINVQIQPYVRLLRAGRTLYMTRTGLTKKQMPFIPGGPFTLSEPMYGRPVCNIGFTGVPPGDYVIEGALVDVYMHAPIGNIYTVNLTVRR
jgi:hypothetical protein